MAYAAVISLKHTIDHLLNCHHSNLPLKQDMSLVYEKVESLQTFLERIFTFESSSSSKRENAIDGRIIDATYKLEDVLECHVSDQFLSESGSLENESHAFVFSPDLQKVKKEINSFAEMVKKIKEYETEFSQPSNLLHVDDVSSRFSFGEENTNEIVGLDDELENLKDRLLGGSSRLKIVPVIGMVGIGKTTLARKVYQDPCVLSDFDYRLWISIGPKYNVDELLFDILFQMDHHKIRRTLKLRVEYFHRMLKSKRYLIVFDDIWSTKVWQDLRMCFPDDDNGSRIIITTTIEEVALHASANRDFHKIRFLTKDESWDLLQRKVFVEELCPSMLEKIGRKIAENCQGLPLAIITVGKHLSKVQKKLECWEKVAENDNSFVIGADDDTYVSKKLSLCYTHLPQHLKACFLYMGVFPQTYEILASKLMMLWIAEGFVELQDGKSVNDVAEKILETLDSRGLVFVRKRSSRNGIKTCTLHYMFRQLCVNIAKKNKFFHIVNDKSFPKGADNYQRRLCIHKNILLSIKDVYNSVASASSTRSLLCAGQYHQYPLRVCLCLRQLRVLDALTIRFYKFPDEILKLGQLRYLGFTFSGDLPTSISGLGKLQIFIVRRHKSIKSAGAISYLPMEIWKMYELTHLQCMGSDLPDPSDAFADHLPNLVELSNVSAESCTREVLSRIPNLKKLGIRIELAPDAAESLCRHLVCLATLYQLESFKCVVTNPNHRAATLLDSFSNLPSCLRKLTLRGCGFSWKDMRIISWLPNLEVLKLQCYSFEGPEWEQYDGEFDQLRFLLLEDLDFQHWKADSMSFRRLERLIIRHCYKLEEVPLGFGDISTLQMIELVDCKSSAVTSAENMQKIQQEIGNHSLQFRFLSSLDERTSSHD